MCEDELSQSEVSGGRIISSELCLDQICKANLWLHRFKRSKTSIDIECQPGTFQQINQITHWLDGSNIYGSSLNESNLLRTFQDGLLKIHEGSEGEELLPKDKSESKECAGDNCYHAGIFFVSNVRLISY